MKSAGEASARRIGMIAENALCDDEPRTQILTNVVSFPAAITWT